MRLQKIVLYNFKGLRGRYVIDDVQPNHNILVGANASGKTSILEAINFVIGENYSGRFRDVVYFLNSQSSEGFVELHFFDVGLHDICIKKNISRWGKNISIFINDSEISKEFLPCILELLQLRFYKSCFLINRKSVDLFTKYSSEERLEYVLKCFGASAYESYIFIRKISEMFDGQRMNFSDVEDLFSELINISKKKYLKKKNSLEMDKMALIYLIYKKALIVDQSKKANLEAQLQSLKTDVTKSRVYEVKNKLNEVKSKMQEQKEYLEDLDSEENSFLAKSEKLTLKLKSLQEEVDFDEKKSSPVSNEKSKLSQRIEILQSSLQKYEEECADLDTKICSKENEQKQLLDLFDKFGKYCSEEIVLQLQEKIKLLEKEIMQIKEEINLLNKANSKLLDEKFELLNKVEIMKVTKLTLEKTLSKEIFGIKLEVDELQNKLRELRRKEITMENEATLLSQTVNKKRLLLQKKVGSNVIKGSESVLGVVDDWKATENSMYGFCYGLVIDCFTCPPEFNLAVQAAIGNRLFSYIVLDNKVGTAILKDMKNYNLPGEVWFLPIKSLKEQTYKYPILKDAGPLLGHLEYVPEYELVMNFLFGGFMLCQNVEVANRVARNFGFNCVTLEGDRVSSRNVMSGGYMDTRNSIRNLYLELANAQKTKSEIDNVLMQTRTQKNEAESAAIQGTIQVQEKRNLLNQKSNELNTEVLLNSINILEKRISNNEETIKAKILLLRKLEGSKNYYEKEIIEGLTMDIDNISSRLETLNREIHVLQKMLKESLGKKYDLDLLVNSCKNKLKFLDDKKQFKMAGQKSLSENKKLIEETNIKLSIVQRRQIQIQEESARRKLILEELNKTRNDLYLQMEQIQERCHSSEDWASLESKIKYYEDKIKYYEDKITSKQSSLSKMYEKNSITDNLYINPDLENLSKYELKKKLKIVYKKLNDLEDVYSKEMVEYKEYKKFNRWLNEDLFSKNCICFSMFVDWLHRLIDIKMEYISEYFTDLFNQITPGGEGYLLADDNGNSEWPELPDITGIEMCTHSPGFDDIWNLQHHSSSQKVATFLALYFAVGRACNVPILIFDEIEMGMSLDQKRLLYRVMRLMGQNIQLFSSHHSLEHSLRVPSAKIIDVNQVKGHKRSEV